MVFSYLFSYHAAAKTIDFTGSNTLVSVLFSIIKLGSPMVVTRKVNCTGGSQNVLLFCNVVSVCHEFYLFVFEVFDFSRQLLDCLYKERNNLLVINCQITIISCCDRFWEDFKNLLSDNTNIVPFFVGFFIPIIGITTD